MKASNESGAHRTWSDPDLSVDLVKVDLNIKNLTIGKAIFIRYE
jgi:hypothetical protein